MADVNLKGVVKRYEGGVTAVDKLDLEIRDHEFMVLVGPSGCGKSTTLRMIAGLEGISDGDLFIGGRRVNETPPRDRDIAMVFQNYALYPHMSVFDNMAFGLKIRKMDRETIRSRVSEAAEILGITEYLERKPKALSGGQRQRVAMGRAIVRNPSVFLFDEPLSNLDAKLRVQMRLELAQLHQRLQTTVVYVTHDQVEAMTLADRIAIMNGGKLQQVGTPMEVFRTPANRFVAGFIGSPAMNFFPVVQCGECVVALEGIQMELPVPVPAHEGKLELGIRPQGFQAVPAGTSGAWTVEVDVVERLGPETYIYFHLGGKPATARIAPDYPVKPGEVISVLPDCGQVHLFSEMGDAILHTALAH